MRLRTPSWLVAVLLAFGLSSPAASALPYTGTLQIDLHFFPTALLSTLPGGTGSGVGGGSAVLGTGSLGGATVLMRDGYGTTIFTWWVDAILDAPASLPGPAAVAGSYKINLFGAINLTVPLGVIGATTGATTMFTNPMVAGLTATATALGAWTVGMATVTTSRTAPMNQHFTTGFDARTPGGRGTVKLVSPVRVDSSVSAFSDMPLLSALTLTFTPEPGTLLLVGAGVAALAALGRKRLRD